MTFWTWTFLIGFAGLLVPTAWLIAQAVGMERTTWGRACLFALCAGAAAFGAMELMPLNFFILKAVAGLFASLLVSPLIFRILMTQETARALLGSVLLTVVGVGGAVLLIVF